MTELTTNASPPSLSAAHTGRNRFVKVKRKLNERPLPILVLEEGAQTCLYLLSSTSEKDANVVSRQTVAIDTFLSELKVLILRGEGNLLPPLVFPQNSYYNYLIE